MTKFRSKPVEIEAVELTEELRAQHLFDGAALPHGMLCVASDIHPGRREVYSARFICASRQGTVTAHVGDWIIQESDGSGCYPCKPDVFAAKYEPAQ